MKQLSLKSAVVLLPPPIVAEPIEAIRRVYDRHFLRWPPHIKLMHPFLPSPSESGELRQDIRMRIEKVTQNIKPFRMSLGSDPPGVFQHSKKNRTVWLGPTTRRVRELQMALQEEFFTGIADRKRDPFRPHLCVGQAKSQHEQNHLCEVIAKSISEFLALDINLYKNKTPTHLNWYVDHVHVIECKAENDRFEIIGTVPFGEPSTSTQQVTSVS